MPIGNYQSGVPSLISNLEQDSNAVTNQDFLRILRVLREQAALPYANIELDNLQHQIDILTHIKPITVNTVSPSTPASLEIAQADDGLSIVVDIPQGADGTQGIQGVQGDSLTFKGVYATLALLQAAFPTGTTGVYVVAADGKWYYWLGSAWVAGGTYQAAAIGKATLTKDLYAASSQRYFHSDYVLVGKNLFDKSAVTPGYKIAGANPVADATFTLSDYIPISPNTQYVRKDTFYGQAFYDSSYVYISQISYTANKYFTTPATAAFIRFSIANENVNSEQFELGAVSTTYEPFALAFKSQKLKSVPFKSLEDIAKNDAYPFQPLATFNNDAQFAEMKNAIKKIEVYGADPTKTYCLGLVNRHNVTYQTRLYIYECNANGTVKDYVCLTTKTNYIEPVGIDEYIVAEAKSSGVYAKIWIDWSKITDGASYDFTHYDKSGLDYRTYMPLTTDEFRITLPPKIYGVVGKEINIYFDNITLSTNINDYNFDVVCTIGTQQNERWTCIPTVAGTTALTINVYKDNVLVGTATTSIVVKASSVGNGVNRRCLFIGDSTTEAGVYTQELLNIQNVDVTKLNLIGTKGIAPDLHEGIGGWSIHSFYTDATSPFVFSGVFNFAQYVSANGYANIDRIGIHLGINDMFAQTDDVTLNANIATTLGELNAMIANIRLYSSTVKIGVMVAIPPSSNQDAFGKNYASGQTRWRYKRNHYLWTKAFIDYFKAREAENIYVVPLNTCLDTVNNMSTETVAVNSRNAKQVVRQSNGIHPALEGYNQMADAIWYWLKSFES